MTAIMIPERRMKVLGLLMLLMPIHVDVLASESNMPAMPYYDWGACPFEGCSYDTWEVCARTVLYKEPDEKTPAVLTIEKKETIQALTGVVITSQPGIVKVLKSITLDDQHPIALKPGDVFYILHYQGEGFDLFWYKGALHSDQMDYYNQLPNAVKGVYYQKMQEPKYDWWVQIKNSAGKVGWTKETEHFESGGECLSGAMR